MSWLTTASQVWTVPAFVAAAIAGVGMGLFVFPAGLRWFLERVVPPGMATPLLGIVPVLTLLFGITAGLAFYISQAVVDLLSGEQLWPRVVARSVIFDVYIAALATGMWLWVRLNRKTLP